MSVMKAIHRPQKQAEAVYVRVHSVRRFKIQNTNSYDQNAFTNNGRPFFFFFFLSYVRVLSRAEETNARGKIYR